MSYVYGNLRIYTTAKPEELEQVEAALQSCDHGEDFKDWFLEDWKRAVKSPQKATGGRQTVKIDHFWDEATPVVEMLVELGQKMPELGLKIVCKVANSVSDSYVRFTVEKYPDEPDWWCPTWFDIGLAEGVLRVDFPKKGDK
ncbi:MAG: hypothetical protein DBY43_05540 [Clostridiaceae bacterium]|nr:MAG: hypothetical protein DBY43_05540 [Clostridiaceae bacterium]